MSAGAHSWQNVVWEGRFQPVHLGHLSYMRRVLERCDHLWVWVLANEVSTDVVADRSMLPVPQFTAAVDPHHRAEKNPLPFWLRYRLVIDAVTTELGSGAPVTVCGGRRLDLQWDLYRKILPPDRVFLTPTRDEFEDSKAAAWAILGEEVARVDVFDLPAISATMIRDRLKVGSSVEGLMAPSTIALLADSGFLDALASQGA